MTHYVQAAEQIPAAALKLKISQVMDAIAFIVDTSEYHKSDEAFHSVVEFVMSRGGVSSVAFAQAFEVNTATISRWKNGKNAPHPRERPAVIAWLQQQLASDLKSTREKLVEIEKIDGNAWQKYRKAASC